MNRIIPSFTLAIAFIALFLAVHLLVTYIVALFSLEQDINIALVYTISMVMVYALLTLYERIRYKELQPIEKRATGFDPLAVLIGVIFIIASSFALLPLNQIFPQDVDVYGKGVFTLLTIVVIAPILEELIFRGRLYNLFGKNISPLASALCTSLIFGVVHFEPVVILGAALIGFMFSCLYLYKRSIITPIILHMCNNALAYALNILSYADKSLTDYISTEGYVVVVIYGLCCIITIVSLVFMIRYFRKEARLQTDKKEGSNQIDEVIYE